MPSSITSGQIQPNAQPCRDEAMADAMIQIERLTKQYADAAVVDDVSMTVPRGTITVVVGSSGSGKSTLLRMINRLVVPTQGRVMIDGRDNAEVPGPELRRGIGYVVQGYGLFPHRT